MLVFAFLFCFESARACSCLRRDSPCKEFREADLLFVGTVKKLSYVKEGGFNDLKASFEIEEAFKGTKADTIDVFTSSQGTACGFRFQEDEKYLVYGYLDKETNKFETNICTRTRYIKFGVPDEEIDILSSLAKGKYEPRIYGIVYELVRGIYPLREDYWESRKVMPGVKIIAKKGNKKFESVSDAQGKFSIKNLPKGKYKFEFVVPPTHKIGGDYWDESTEDERNYYKNLEVEITDTDCPDSLQIETRVDGRIRGRVFDTDGKPAGKEVMVSLISKSTAGKEIGDIDYTHAWTDENGYYEFFGIPPGEYYLGFNIETKPNKLFPYPRTYFPKTSDVANAKVIVLGKAEKLYGFDLYLPEKVPEIEVKGKVVDAAGNPVKGAIVERYGLYYGEPRPDEPYSMRYIKQPTFEGRVETNEKGEFTLKLLKGNKYRLNVYLEEKNSYKNLLEGDDIDIEVTGEIKPVILILDKKPE